ncbi:DMT family transporter [Thiomicrorhabdus sediminis]|uniref:DMT family transporter n=1 Tax=Thiomicrorhabdus sediminis TaxID=2580412 RepID=A0A4P9K740_9GAMM|nr:DMT family transporter [Thiomicrorhabdus sediminis]QCU90146.1 DMT family transporter [Thiomicrorhabdus sediminis]
MAVIIAYLMVVLIWTTTPLAIVWGGADDWFFAVAGRTALGALLILLVYYWYRWRSATLAFSFRVEALRVYFFAALPIFGGMTIMYWAGQFLPSGWIAVLFALTPVTTGLLAYLLLPEQQLSWRKWLAIFISLGGLLIIFVPNLSLHLESLQIYAILAAICSVCLHSLGSVLVKRCHVQLPALHIVIGALWFSVLGHFLIAPETLISWPQLSDRAAWAIAYAASVGSVIGFLFYFYLVRQVDAMKVALIPVLTPVSAMMFGVLFNNETVSVTMWIGTAVFLTGLLLFEWRFKRRT